MTSNGTKCWALTLCSEVLFRTWQAFLRAPEKLLAHESFHWSRHTDSVSPLSNSICLLLQKRKQKSKPAVKYTRKGKSPWKPVKKELWERWAIALRLGELQWGSHKGEQGWACRLVSSSPPKGFSSSLLLTPAAPPLPSLSLFQNYFNCFLIHPPVLPSTRPSILSLSN